MNNGARLGSVMTLLLLAIGSFPLVGAWPHLASWSHHEEGWQQSLELDRLTRIGHWRVRSKAVVLQAWSNDQLSFLETASWFQRLSNLPDDTPQPPNPDLDCTREEQACRQVIAWAEKRQPGIARRLEAQLAQELARPGGLVLPEPPPLEGIPPCPKPEE
jgi:hypothetical protein